MDNRANTSKSNLGAYTKSSWKLGKTIAIRIPEKIKDRVLEYAKKLDIGKEGNDRSEIINEVIEKLEYAIRPKGEGGGYDGRKAKELRNRISEAIAMLKE